MKTLYFFLILILICASAIAQNPGWAYINPLPQNDFYAVKFFDTNTGYVCGSNGIILKTLTGNNQWINISIDQSNNLYSMYFFDASHGFISGDDGLIIRTTNGGFSWINIPSGTADDLRSITFVNSATGFAAGNNGIIIKSINGGSNWSVVNDSGRNLHSIFFINSNTGFAAGDSGLFMKTTNSGVNWSSQTLGTMSLRSIFFTSAQTGILATAVQGTTSFPLRSTDGGATWNQVNLFYWGSWYCVKFKDQDTGYMVGNNCPMLKTFDGGITWFAHGMYNVASPLHVYDISPVNSSCTFACGTSGYVLKTADGVTSINIGGTKASLNSISFATANMGSVTGSNQCMNTLNGGLNWSIDMVGFIGWHEGQNTTFKLIRYYSPTSAYRIYSNYQPTMGTWDDMDHSTDGGITWEPSFSTFMPPSAISAICEVQGIGYMAALGKIYKNSGAGWVVVYNPGVYFPAISFANQNTGIAFFTYPYRGFAKTSDGGTSWSLEQVNLGRQLNDIQLMPSGLGYAAGDSSFLARTTNYGNYWTVIPNSINSYILKLQFLNDNTGWLLARHIGYSYTNRLYYTSDGGSSLIEIQSLDSFNVKDMSFLNASTGFVCGNSGVVLRTTNGGLAFVKPISSIQPDNFSLSQNYPNPFNPKSNIKFQIAKSGLVKLVVFDALGQEISQLVNERLSPGTYKVQWDGTNYPSGVYFYKLISADFTETRKMVLVK